MADELIDDGMDWAPLSGDELAALAKQTLRSGLMREEPRNSGISVQKAFDLLEKLANNDVPVNDLFPPRK